MATTKFIESGGDATNDLSFYAGSNTVNSTVAYDSTQYNDGIGSIKCNITSQSSSIADVYTADGIVSDAGALISAWFKFSSVTPTNRALFLTAAQTGNGSSVIYVGLNTNGTLHTGGRGSTFQDGTTTLLANTWYRISVSYLITSSTNWSMKVYINGVLETSSSNTNGTLSLVATTCVALGIPESSQELFNNPPVLTVWVDSVYIDNRSDNSDCGNVHVTAKRPYSNGTTTGFSTSGTPSGYGSGHAQYVNYRPIQTATANVNMVGAGSAVTEEYNIENAATGDNNLTGATIVDYVGWLYAKSLATETGSIVVNNVTSNISLTSANTLFTKIAGSTSYPAGTGTDLGIITTTALTTVTLYDAGMVVAYIPSAATAPTGYASWASSPISQPFIGNDIQLT